MLINQRTQINASTRSVDRSLMRKGHSLKIAIALVKAGEKLQTSDIKKRYSYKSIWCRVEFWCEYDLFAWELCTFATKAKCAPGEDVKMLKLDRSFWSHFSKPNRWENHDPTAVSTEQPNWRHLSSVNRNSPSATLLKVVKAIGKGKLAKPPLKQKGLQNSLGGINK